MQGRNITGTTHVAGIIGDPVSHTYSPAMQNAAFAAAGLDWVYLAWRVPSDLLREAVRGLGALGVAGFNVTVPHKVSILPLLDEVEEDAEAIGAVNTVTLRDGRLHGANTDSEGFLRSLAASGVHPEGSRVVLLGAGGAARAVGYALARARVAALHIANRNAPRAVALAEDLAGRGPGPVTASGLESPQLEEALGQAELIVHATSSGHSGGGLPVSAEWLPAGHVLYDLSYGRASGPVAAAAVARGLRVITGEEMLLHQGALAFTAWTGEEPCLDAMREGLKEAVRAVSQEESSSSPSK